MTSGNITPQADAPGDSRPPNLASAYGVHGCGGHGAVWLRATVVYWCCRLPGCLDATRLSEKAVLGRIPRPPLGC